MPWTARDAYRHTKKASTPELQNRWSRIANERLQAGDDEASAIRQANAAVENSKPTKPKAKSNPESGPEAPRRRDEGSPIVPGRRVPDDSGRGEHDERTGINYKRQI